MTLALSSYWPYTAESTTESATHASQCYTQLDLQLGCDLFVQPRLPVLVDQNAPCPFANLCLSNNSNLRLDTGLINSRYDLGINTPIDERVWYRKVLHCAPLKTDAYTAQYNISQELSYKRYYYGPLASYNYIFEAVNGVYRQFKTENHTSFDTDYSIG